MLKRKDPELILVGEIAMPAIIPRSHEMHNKKTLTKLLNEGDCFDVELHPENWDLLELYFACKSQVGFSEKLQWHGDYLAYSFTYFNGEWKILPYVPYIDGQELLKGEIVNALLEAKRLQ